LSLFNSFVQINDIFYRNKSMILDPYI